MLATRDAAMEDQPLGSNSRRAYTLKDLETKGFVFQDQDKLWLSCGEQLLAYGEFEKDNSGYQKSGPVYWIFFRKEIVQEDERSKSAREEFPKVIKELISTQIQVCARDQ